MTGAEAAPIRVVIVDDDAMVRTALKMFVGGRSGIEVVGEAADGAAGVEIARRERPDIVLMDMRMPLRDGLSATEEVRALPDPPQVIVLTTRGPTLREARGREPGADRHPRA